MVKTYLIDGQQVTVTWSLEQHPPVYTVGLEGELEAGAVEMTAIVLSALVDC